jgi:hypothetical protein
MAGSLDPRHGLDAQDPPNGPERHPPQGPGRCKYSKVLWQGRWCLLLQSVIVICVARKVTALAVGVGLLELGEPKCVRELVELCR